MIIIMILIAYNQIIYNNNNKIMTINISQAEFKTKERTKQMISFIIVLVISIYKLSKKPYLKAILKARAV